MQGDIGFANGSWYYIVRLGPVDGMAERMCVSGFTSERNARLALEAVDLRDLQARARQIRDSR